MSYTNFIPTVWAKAIQRELVRESVFAADCNREYEGEVSKAGDRVRILGIGKPTITKSKGTEINLKDPEAVADTSSTLIIENVAHFNFLIDDIDKRQAQGTVMESLMSESNEGLSNAVDEDIAALAKDKMAVKQAAATLTEANVLQYVDKCVLALLENDVSRKTKIIATVPPWFWMLVKNKLTTVDTDNSGRLRSMEVGNYGNVEFRCSNNVAKDDSGNSLPMFRTKRAIAAVQPMTHVEPYRPEKKFSDAVKGFVLYGQKIVRPKELIVLPCKSGT